MILFEAFYDQDFCLIDIKTGPHVTTPAKRTYPNVSWQVSPTKILNLEPCVRNIVEDDHTQMEAQNTIKRKLEERAVRVKKGKLEEAAKLVAWEAWKKKVKHKH